VLNRFACFLIYPHFPVSLICLLPKTNQNAVFFPVNCESLSDILEKKTEQPPEDDFIGIPKSDTIMS